MPGLYNIMEQMLQFFSIQTLPSKSKYAQVVNQQNEISTQQQKFVAQFFESKSQSAQKLTQSKDIYELLKKHLIIHLKESKESKLQFCFVFLHTTNAWLYAS